MDKVDLMAFIPARGGSKRVKNKNLANISGTSLIGRSIMAVQQTNLNVEICVSTDSKLIQEEVTKFTYVQVNLLPMRL